MGKFKTCQNKGFHMTFDNGWTISVQFGKGNYCDNRGNLLEFKQEILEGAESETAEIAIFDNNDNWHPLSEYDDVEGWLDTESVLFAMNWVSNQEPK